MKRLLQIFLVIASFFATDLSVAAPAKTPAKAPAKPAGPDKNSIEYKLDKAFITGFFVESCPVSVAIKLINTKKLNSLKVKFDIKVKPDQDRSITWDLRKRTSLRDALNQLKKYGYSWYRVKNGVVVTPIGKPVEWVTGIGCLKIMDGESKWLNTARVRNVKLTNATFAEVENLLRKQKYKVTGVGKTPVRVTLAAGNATLKQFLSAVCMATGFDCEVNKQSIRFRKGPRIGYTLFNADLKKNMIKYKYPNVGQSVMLGDFLLKVAGSSNTVWVFLHRGIGMANFRGVVSSEISGMTFPDVISLVEKNLNVNIRFVDPGVVLMIINPKASRQEFANRLQMNLSDLKFQNAPLKKVLDSVTEMSKKADSKQLGLPIILAMKKVPADKINVDIEEIRAEEFLRRLATAINCYGYVSQCGTSYVWVGDNLFGFKEITVHKLNPVLLKKIPSGIDRVDIPLDFAGIDFKNATVENTLKFIKKLCFSRFGTVMSVRWGISSKEKLNRKVTFSIKEPTLRMILDELSLRGNVQVEFRVNGIYVK